MSGYTPVFDTIFNGTLCGKWPELPVWLTLLPLADWRGHIDMTPEAIAARTGWPIDLLMRGIEALCLPDPRSRSRLEDGRRLIPIDPERPWGWRVVNIKVYRDKASGQDQIADGRNAEKVRRYRERHRETPEDTEQHPETPTHTHTHTQTQTEEAKAIYSRAREDGTSIANPIHDWRKTPGIDLQAFGDWLAYLDQAQKQISAATEVSMSKALAATGGLEHQRKLVAYLIQQGWKNIRNVDLDETDDQKPTQRKTRYEQLYGG